MSRRFRLRAAALSLGGVLLLAACAGPGATAKPTAAAVQGSAAKPAAAAQKAPGPYVKNGEADASSGKVAAQMLDAMKFSPNTFTKVKRGATVTVELKNTGATVHDFYSPPLGVTTAVKVSPGQSGTATFTAPSTAGTYQFWCQEPGHAEAGMVGEVIVE